MSNEYKDWLRDHEYDVTKAMIDLMVGDIKICIYSSSMSRDDVEEMYRAQAVKEVLGDD